MSETTKTKEKIVLGTCPVCGKGQIVKGSAGYACDQFQSADNQCEFIIYSKYFDKELSDEMAKQIVEKGETDTFIDFHTKEGKPFTASLKIEDSKVKVNFKNSVLETPCPVCQGKMEELLTGYACENYTKIGEGGEHICKTFIPKVICEMEIPKQAVETLLNGNQTKLIAGFKKKDGTVFASRLQLTNDLNVVFSNNLCKCPQCGDGLIYDGKKAYNCSNFKNEAIKCNFTIWKSMLGRAISEEEAIQLCQDKETSILTGFVKDGVTMERKLVIGEGFKVVLA